MMNQTCIIGRLVRDPELKELEDGKKVSNITVAVQRSYKNENGEYEADFIDCTLWNGVADRTAEYCKKGDLVGVKGRLQTNTYENEDGEKKKITEVIAEKLTFLSSNKEILEKEGVNKTKEEDLEV
mgnify:FL=1